MIIPSWVWTLGLSLLVQLLSSAVIVGKVGEKIEGLVGRVGRLENQMDHRMGRRSGD